MATAKKLPSGSWRCIVYDYTDANGKRKYKSITNDDPSPAGKRMCERDAAEYAALKAQLRSNNSSLTISEALDKYISTYPQLSESTVAGYRTIQKYGFQNIISSKLSSLSKEILQEAINEECNRPSQSTRSKGEPISKYFLKER